MKVQDIALVGLVVLVLLLVLWNFRSSGYTSVQVRTMIDSAVPPSVKRAPTFMTNVISIVLNGTKNQSFLTQANALIASINATNYFSTQLVPYTSDAQFETLFGTAYTSGESSLSATDRVLLRAIYAIGADVSTSTILGTRGLPALTYTIDGQPSWAPAILAQTGLTLEQNLIKTLEIFENNSGQPDQVMVNQVNALLPSGLTPFASVSDLDNKMSSSTTLDPSAVWLHKFIFIGPLYIVWIAENKWKLDPTWSLTVRV